MRRTEDAEERGRLGEALGRCTVDTPCMANKPTTTGVRSFSKTTAKQKKRRRRTTSKTIANLNKTARRRRRFVQTKHPYR